MSFINVIKTIHPVRVCRLGLEVREIGHRATGREGARQRHLLGEGTEDLGSGGCLEKAGSTCQEVPRTRGRNDTQHASQRDQKHGRPCGQLQEGKLR